MASDIVGTCSKHGTYWDSFDCPRCAKGEPVRDLSKLHALGSGNSQVSHAGKNPPDIEAGPYARYKGATRGRRPSRKAYGCRRVHKAKTVCPWWKSDE